MYISQTLLQGMRSEDRTPQTHVYLSVSDPGACSEVESAICLKQGTDVHISHVVGYRSSIASG
jgi:hypothetical protein